jgi:hypothetical protein
VHAGFSFRNGERLASVSGFWYGNVYGEVSEWFNVLVLKTNVAQVTVGSNPTLSEQIKGVDHEKKKLMGRRALGFDL